MTTNDFLRDSQIRLRLISEVTEEGVIVHDHGVILDANEAFARIFGFQQPEVIGMLGESFTTPETWSKIMGRSLDAAEAPFEGIGFRKDRTPVYVQLVCKPYPAEGRHLRITVFRDITAQRHAEELRRRSEERYRVLFNSMLDGLLVVEIVKGEGSDYTVLEVNPAFESLTGLRARDILGRSVHEILASSNEPWVDLLDAVAESGSSRRIERFSGVLDKFIEVQAFCPEPGRIAVILSDVTERKRLDDRLRQAAKLEAIGSLASGVAHEINNPINVIMNYASLLQRDGMSSEKVKAFASEIVAESGRVASIVRNLQSFARQELEVPVPTSITEVLDATLDLTRKVLSNDQITLELEVPGDLPRILCRPQLIVQVLVNLITNARQALNDRFTGYDPGKVLRIACEPVQSGDDRMVRITVEDHGIGVSREARERIFDPFYSARRGGLGSGLGLSVSQGIVEDHGGRLWLAEDDGTPTRFHLDLPVHEE
jgi:PAS domain S-box-containing protein